ERRENSRVTERALGRALAVVTEIAAVIVRDARDTNTGARELGDRSARVDELAFDIEIADRSFQVDDADRARKQRTDRIEAADLRARAEVNVSADPQLALRRAAGEENRDERQRSHRTRTRGSYAAMLRFTASSTSISWRTRG